MTAAGSLALEAFGAEFEGRSVAEDDHRQTRADPAPPPAPKPMPLGASRRGGDGRAQGGPDAGSGLGLNLSGNSPLLWLAAAACWRRRW